MDEAMRQAKEKWLEEQTLARYYRKMRFNNLVSRAEHMEEKGYHLEEKLTQRSLTVSIAEIASHMSVTPESRHRMAKEVAEELLKEKGEFAHFYCAEKLANNTSAPRLWRDVLTYLDEMEKPHGRVDTDDDRPRGEQANHTDDDS